MLGSVGWRPGNSSRSPIRDTRDGVVSFAIDSTTSDGSTWGTREYTQKPQLLIDVE